MCKCINVTYIDRQIYIALFTRREENSRYPIPRPSKRVATGCRRAEKGSSDSATGRSTRSPCPSLSMPSVCVVGAGVVGLTTATLLQEARPGVRVTLFADKFEEDTTSVGAAGLFTPGAMFRGPSEDVTWRWLAEGFAYYKRLLQSPEADEAGVVELSGYKLSVNDPGHVRVGARRPSGC
ncbi:D-aspartate oxidase-like [Penaeus japonicus]|uniref:D-aspartate oxidase-like n=1 Tax=Penaeus japonicus TaxID=27405 RepID=UPI001C7178FD|nr:D-aspartate oxidase-like [Penaeus japonicus]